MSRRCLRFRPRPHPRSCPALGVKPGPGAGRQHGTDAARGAVTAELAVGLPAVAVLLAAVLTGVAAGVTQIRVEEAARASAREVMRGEGAAAGAAARRIAGSDARISITADGDWWQVRVSSAVDAPLLSLLPLELTATALALPENPDAGLPR